MQHVKEMKEAAVSQPLFKKKYLVMTFMKVSNVGSSMLD